jgi:hypothetical protein
MPWTAEHRELRATFDGIIDANEARLGAERVKYLRARQDRDEMNDDLSPYPGITVYLRDDEVEENGTWPERMARIVRMHKNRSYLEAIKPAENMVAGCYSLDLLEGGFVVSCGLRFFQAITFEGIEFAEGEEAFNAPYEAVVRVEGLGALWMNQDYNLDGSLVTVN